MEIFITILIILIAVFIIYKNIRKSSKGYCNCGSCSSHCPKNKKLDTNISITNNKKGA